MLDSVHQHARGLSRHLGVGFIFHSAHHTISRHKRRYRHRNIILRRYNPATQHNMKTKQSLFCRPEIPLFLTPFQGDPVSISLTYQSKISLRRAVSAAQNPSYANFMDATGIRPLVRAASLSSWLVILSGSTDRQVMENRRWPMGSTACWIVSVRFLWGSEGR
jgi:hypothetical protein